MRIIRNMVLAIIVVLAFTGIDRTAGNQPITPEDEIIVSDHSVCETIIDDQQQQIDALRNEVQELRRSADLVLRIEIEVIPGVFGDWSVIRFHSGAIRISQAVADTLTIGEEIDSIPISESAILGRIIGCRIIVESIDA